MVKVLNLTPQTKRLHGSDPYTYYEASTHIDIIRFNDVIQKLGGYVYNVSVGKIEDITIFNGYTWLSIKGTGSHEANDRWAKKFEDEYNNIA